MGVKLIPKGHEASRRIGVGGVFAVMFVPAGGGGAPEGRKGADVERQGLRGRFRVRAAPRKGADLELGDARREQPLEPAFHPGAPRLVGQGEIDRARALQRPAGLRRGGAPERLADLLQNAVDRPARHAEGHGDLGDREVAATIASDDRPLLWGELFGQDRQFGTWIARAEDGRRRPPPGRRRLVSTQFVSVPKVYRMSAPMSMTIFL